MRWPKFRGFKPAILPQPVRGARRALKGDKLLTAEQRIAEVVKIVGEENRDRVKRAVSSVMRMQGLWRRQHERRGKLRNKRFANQFEAALRRMSTLASKAPAEWWKSSNELNRDQLLRHFDELRAACASQPPIDGFNYRTYVVSPEHSTPWVYYEIINETAGDRGRMRGPYFEAQNKELAAMAAFALCTECGMKLKAKIAALLYGDERADLDHHCRHWNPKGLCDLRHVKPLIRGKCIPGSAVRGL